jgi:hypothetical protein
MSWRGGKTPRSQKKDDNKKNQADSFHKPPAFENEHVTSASTYRVRMNNATKMLPHDNLFLTGLRRDNSKTRPWNVRLKANHREAEKYLTVD